MRQNYENPTDLIIESADDACTAMYEHGLKKSLGGILEYFMAHRDTDDFEGFCHYLNDEEDLNEALDYFLENFNQSKFVMFFNALNVNQQASLLSLLITDVCDSKEVAQDKQIIRFRQHLCSFDNWKKQTKLPENVQSAIKSAQDNSFDKVIHFLQENPLQIRKFVSQLSELDKDMVLNGLVLELMNKLPYKVENQDNGENVSFAA